MLHIIIERHCGTEMKQLYFEANSNLKKILVISFLFCLCDLGWCGCECNTNSVKKGSETPLVGATRPQIKFSLTLRETLSVCDPVPEPSGIGRRKSCRLDSTCPVLQVNFLHSLDSLYHPSHVLVSQQQFLHSSHHAGELSGHTLPNPHRNSGEFPFPSPLQHT